ncbi:MAG: DUF4258 domain-containing protein [Candidatus Schekmanbacteria bacterium]|nr:DUF4258 domain-containing protein [Candidatus Schekmanbacteria bacterium]
MNLLQKIQTCFSLNSVLYTRHARAEMRDEEFGQIMENEVCEAISAGEIIEDYPGDTPYPSMLILGETLAGRSLHVVCAYARQDNLAIIITVYQPDPGLWIEYKRRKP